MKEPEQLGGRADIPVPLGRNGARRAEPDEAICTVRAVPAHDEILNTAPHAIFILSGIATACGADPSDTDRTSRTTVIIPELQRQFSASIAVLIRPDCFPA
jgi:hypothetical protein